MARALFSTKGTYGEQKLVVGYGKLPWEEFAARSPMSEQAKKDFVRVQTDQRDYLPELSPEEKYAKLSKMSYYDFLKDIVKVHQQVLEIYRRWGMSYWVVGIDEVPVTSIQSYDGGMPGLDHTLKRSGHRGDEPYIFHFPDGNASIARLLVRQLIPGSVPGSTMEDVVTARADYSMLDRDDADVRIRLNSTAVDARHTANGKFVDVTYVTNGDAHTVRADKCILACYNAAIPFIASELPETQKKGLAYNVKVPLAYVKVMVPDWRAFADLGMDFAYYTNDFFKQVELDYPVTLGDYKFKHVAG